MQPSHAAFEHGEITMPFTLAQRTKIHMPIQDEETIYAALFVLEKDVPVDVSFAMWNRFQC